MQKRWKKMMAVLSVMAISTGMLAGCGQSAGETKSEASNGGDVTINCTDLSSILFSERLSPNIILCSVIIISLFDLFAI